MYVYVLAFIIIITATIIITIFTIIIMYSYIHACILYGANLSARACILYYAGNKFLISIYCILYLYIIFIIY